LKQYVLPQKGSVLEDKHMFLQASKKQALRFEGDTKRFRAATDSPH
jgi:hypothetical protein